MKNSKLMLLAVVVALVSVAAAQGAWKQYVYDDDGFAISAPQAPTMSKANVDTAAGPIEMHNYMVELGDDAAMLASVADYGANLLKADPKAVLQGGKEGAMKNTNSHLVSERDITLQGYPGLAIETENDTMHFSAHFYLVKSRLYQTVVVTSVGKPFADTERFHDSLHFLEK